MYHATTKQFIVVYVPLYNKVAYRCCRLMIFHSAAQNNMTNSTNVQSLDTGTAVYSN